VKQPGCYAGDIKFQLSQNSSNLKRMIEIRLPGKADLSQMNFGGKDIRLSQEVRVRIRVIRS
jgi:hypothetical protein